MVSGPEVAQVAYNAGWRGKDLEDAVSVSFAEDTSHAPAAHNYCCWGLWQINILVHNISQSCVTDPQCNANYAYGLWKQQGWGPWTTWPVAANLHRNAARAAIAQANLSGSSSSSSDCSGVDTSAGCTHYDKLGCVPGATGDALKACIQKQPALAHCFACLAAGGAASTLKTSSGCQSDTLSGGIVCLFSGIEDAVKAVVGGFLWLLSPSHWVRIAEAVGGGVLVLLAILFLFLYSHRDEVKGVARSVT